MSDYRIERDSLGDIQIPVTAQWGAQTQRAVENFPISGLTMPAGFIRALGLIKASAAEVNRDLGHLDTALADAISQTALQIAKGEHLDQFPVDVFQTGSGTSSNMNTNEVIAHLASTESGEKIHPNDHVNMGQSSNDVIPTAIHVSAALAVHEQLLPALQHLSATLQKRANELQDTVKTGRTHLMDAMPVTLGQELGAWQQQINNAAKRLQQALPQVLALAQGGTAVGSGINADPEFGQKFAARISQHTKLEFTAAKDYFERLATQDTAVALSGQLRTLAVALMKIANDLRWMNSGPLTGLAEIELPALQPGSSIMPGKVNPVIPEAVAMVSAQVIGNDTTITVAGQSGNFQLNVMLPVIGYNLLQSIELSANACRILADKAIKGFTVNEERLQAQVARNPILVTALNPVIGYEKGAAIAKKAYAEQRAVIDVALDETDLSREQLEQLLDPLKLTQGGIQK